MVLVGRPLTKREEGCVATRRIGELPGFPSTVGDGRVITKDLDVAIEQIADLLEPRDCASRLLAHRSWPLSKRFHDPERSRHRREPRFLRKLTSASWCSLYRALCHRGVAVS